MIEVVEITVFHYHWKATAITTIYFKPGAGSLQWSEFSVSTNVAQNLPDGTPYVGWVCWVCTTLLQEFSLIWFNFLSFNLICLDFYSPSLSLLLLLLLLSLLVKSTDSFFITIIIFNKRYVPFIKHGSVLYKYWPSKSMPLSLIPIFSGTSGGTNFTQPALIGFSAWPALTDDVSMWQAVTGDVSIWPALSVDVSIQPALTGDVSVWPALTGDVSVWPALAGNLSV